MRQFVWLLARHMEVNKTWDARFARVIIWGLAPYLKQGSSPPEPGDIFPTLKTEQQSEPDRGLSYLATKMMLEAASHAQH